MSMDTDIAYLAVTPNPLELGPAASLNVDVPINGGRAPVPNPPSTARFVKIGDQATIDSRRAAYGTYNPSYYFCSISVRFRCWNGNPGIGTYLKRKVIGDFRARNNNAGPVFSSAPFGAEWFYSWNQHALLIQLVQNLEAAKVDGGAAINNALTAVIVGWRPPNQPPAWTQGPGYAGIEQFLGQNRRIVDIQNNGGALSVRFVNEVAAYIYLQDFISTD